MDKNQNVRRLFSRPFGYNSNKKLVSGNSENEKSSKEKFKRLSVVEREMGFDAEDELYSTKVNSGKFKLPAKIFSDSTTSVPRKLRSGNFLFF
ncbi:Protein P [Bienertia sinuspersici]